MAKSVIFGVNPYFPYVIHLCMGACFVYLQFTALYAQGFRTFTALQANGNFPTRQENRKQKTAKVTAH